MKCSQCDARKTFTPRSPEISRTADEEADEEDEAAPFETGPVPPGVSAGSLTAAAKLNSNSV